MSNENFHVLGSINTLVKNFNDLTPKYFVYYLLDEKGKPFYLGKGSGNRPKNHFRKHSLKKLSLKNDKIRELKNITGEFPNIKILKTHLIAKDAFNLEKRLIKKFGRVDKGTGFLLNETDGGGREKGWIMPQFCKDKISNALKGRKKIVTWGNAISKGKKGKQFTREHRTNLAKANHLRLKGKRMIEIYGKEEADRLRVIQKKNLMKLGMTWEQRYGKTKAEQLRLKRKQNKGKTWEEIYGIEGAKKRREAAKQRVNQVCQPKSLT